MASTTEIPMEHERHHIAQEHDLIIIVRETKLRGEGRDREHFILVHEFEVAAAVMREYRYFNVVFDDKQWADTGKGSYEIKGDDPAAWEVWLQLLHGCLDTTEVEAKISTIWNLLVLAVKYNFDGHCPELKKWFFAWYETFCKHKTFNQLVCRELLYPCYFFDHAITFAAVTEFLVYNMNGHIEEHMPDGVEPIQKEHHMANNRVIGSLNAARGSLKTKLHGYLYSPCRRLLGSVPCKIKEKVFYQYHKGLEQTGAWPIEIHGNKNSINGLLRLVGKFKYDDPHVGSKAQAGCEEPRDCMNGPKFKAVISNTTAELNDQFDGLCLDCMNCSGNRAEDADSEYWNHSAQGPWDTGCRISHGQPTWYFSFLGRREKMSLFQQKLRRN